MGGRSPASSPPPSRRPRPPLPSPRRPAPRLGSARPLGKGKKARGAGQERGAGWRGGWQPERERGGRGVGGGPGGTSVEPASREHRRPHRVLAGPGPSALPHRPQPGIRPPGRPCCRQAEACSGAGECAFRGGRQPERAGVAGRREPRPVGRPAWPPATRGAPGDLQLASDQVFGASGPLLPGKVRKAWRGLGTGGAARGAQPGWEGAGGGADARTSLTARSWGLAGRPRPAPEPTTPAPAPALRRRRRNLGRSPRARTGRVERGGDLDVRPWRCSAPRVHTPAAWPGWQVQGLRKIALLLTAAQSQAG